MATHQHMHNNVQHGTSTQCCRWVEMVCPGHRPLNSQNKVLQSLHTILAGYYCLSPLAGRDKHHVRCAFPRLMSVHVSTDILLDMSLKVLLYVSTPQGCMEASGWKYIFSTGDCVSCTHNLMGGRFAGLLPFLNTLKKIMR